MYAYQLEHNKARIEFSGDHQAVMAYLRQRNNRGFH
jgi:hypothetical protein